MSSPREDDLRLPSAEPDDAYRRPEGVADPFAPRPEPHVVETLGLTKS